VKEKRENKHKGLKTFIRILTVFICFVGLLVLGYYIFALLGGKAKLRDDIQKWTKENLALGCFLYLALGPIVNLVPGISSIFFITLANRRLNDKTPLGMSYAFLLADASVLLTTVFLFLMGRIVGKKAVGWRIGQEEYEKRKRALNIGGKAALPFIYLFPAFPDDTMSFVCGRSDISLGYNFLMALLFRSIGVLCCCVLGTDFFDYKSFTWWMWLIALFCFLTAALLMILAVKAYYSYLKRKECGIKYDLVKGLKPKRSLKGTESGAKRTNPF